MANFTNGIQLTKQGHLLNTKILARGIQFEVKAIAIGDGLAAAQRNQNALSNELYRTGSIKTKIINDTVALFEIDFSQFAADATKAWVFREIGIFAADPDLGEILYAYGNCGNDCDTIPAHGSNTYLKRILRLPVEIAEAEKVFINLTETYETTAANIGDEAAGAGVFSHQDTNTRKSMFRRLAAGDGVTVREQADTILISSRKIIAGQGIKITEDPETGNLTISLEETE